ncbi:MAG: aminoacyl-tRNA hydrolase [Elusimicrobiota bacterium]|nr:aminoacyl-tRNA hydrolase [Elusimicrobiota bacterium]
MAKKIIIGLGNPGLKYERTRHNAGFMAADALGKKFKKDRNSPALISVEDEFIIAKPATYMNRSGFAVKKIADNFKCASEDLLIVHDDFNLPLGKLRIKPAGSAGGHNGLQSVIERLGTNKIPRLRLGIGGPAVKDRVKYVLEKFSKAELDLMTDMIIDAKRVIYYYIKHGMEEAMNKYN